MTKHTIDQHYQKQKPSITAPEHLDEVIISQATRAVEHSGNNAKPKTNAWFAPLSTAATFAVCGIAFLLVSNTSKELDYSVALNTAQNDYAVETSHEITESVEAHAEVHIESYEESDILSPQIEVASANMSAPQDSTTPSLIIDNSLDSQSDKRLSENDTTVYDDFVTQSYPVAQEDVLIAEAGKPVYHSSGASENVAEHTYEKQKNTLAKSNIARELPPQAEPVAPMPSPVTSIDPSTHVKTESIMVHPPTSQQTNVKPLESWAKRVIMLINGNQATLAKREYTALKKAYPNADQYDALKPYIEQLNAD